MIDSISNTGIRMPAPPHRQGEASFTDAQKLLISDTLSKFNVEKLTEADAKSIVSIFQEAGIQPGKELAEIMESAGFDAREVGDMAGLQGPSPDSSSGHREGINFSEEAMKELYTLLDQYYAEDTAGEERNNLIDSIQQLLGSETRIFSAKA